MKYITGFGRFWYDFIVGDSVFLAIGGPVALVSGYLLTKADYSALGEVLLPAIVILTLFASLRQR